MFIVVAAILNGGLFLQKEKKSVEYQHKRFDSVTQTPWICYQRAVNMSAEGFHSWQSLSQLLGKQRHVYFAALFLFIFLRDKTKDSNRFLSCSRADGWKVRLRQKDGRQEEEHRWATSRFPGWRWRMKCGRTAASPAPRRRFCSCSTAAIWTRRCWTPPTPPPQMSPRVPAWRASSSHSYTSSSA